MAGELVAAIEELHKLLQQIPEFRQAAQYPPDKPGSYPVVTIYPASGSWEKESSGQLKGLHTIRIGAFVPRKDLARDVEKILPLGDKIKDKLFVDANATWSSTIDTIVGPINYIFGPFDYESLTLLGWQIDAEIKIKSIEANAAYSKG